MTTLRNLWDRIRQGLWFVPSVIVLACAGLAGVMIQLDAFLYRSDLEPTSLIFGGSAEGARGVLGAIAGGLITVTGVVFSITIVALQLASTQFTPRVLQNFMNDRGNQIVLGVFLGTFTYTLLILRTIRAATEGFLAFVPGASVTVAVVLTLVSMGLLIYYLQHVAGWIEASSIIDRVTHDTLHQIRKRFPLDPVKEHAPSAAGAGTGQLPLPIDGDADEDVPMPDGTPAALVSRGAGYMQRTDTDMLLERAIEHDLTIRVEHAVGEFVVEGTPLLSIWPADALDPALEDSLREAIVLGPKRTITQDAELGIIQLADIAVKAMSPSINDPTTAITAIDRLGQILAELSGRFMRGHIRMDPDGHERVVAPAFGFEHATDVAFSQIRRYAGADPTVMIHLARTIELIAPRVRERDREALVRMLDEIEEGSGARIEHEPDRNRLTDAVGAVRSSISRLGLTMALLLGLLATLSSGVAAQQAGAGIDTAGAAVYTIVTVDTVAADEAGTSLADTIVGSARHIVVAFASDTWSTFAAPFRLDREEAWKVGGAVGVVALLMVFDEDIQRAIERNRDATVPSAVEDVGLFVEPFALMGNTNIYWAGGMMLGHVTGQDRVRHIFEELLFSHWIASITRKGIGRPIGRLRPVESPGDAFARKYWTGTSFPSGHASTATQVAAVLAHHIDWWPADVVLYGLAASVVYHRVAVGHHWASDSLLGALWGYGVTQVVIDRREADRTDFVPFFDPGAGAIGVRIATPF